MTIRGFLIALVTFGALAACTDDGTYPITGEECTADDAVLEMSADCPDLIGTGSF